jgi:fructose-1,6-bisphosphatase/inositol monophosphatase family enzyme
MTATDAEVAIAAAEAGAEVIRTRYGRPGERTAKIGIDFVTQTDLEAEQAILDVVRAALPTMPSWARRPACSARPTQSEPGWSTRCAAP